MPDRNTMVFEELAPSLRQAVDRWPSAGNLQKVYEDLKSTYVVGGISVVELCNGFTECVARTILCEVGKDGEASDQPTITELVTVALREVGAKTDTNGGEVSKVLSGHKKIAEGLRIWRNREGAAAHGKDGWMSTITENHARVFLLSTDALVAILLAAYEGKGPDVRYSREESGRFAHLNERIDRAAIGRVTTDVDDDGTIVVTFGDQEGLNKSQKVEVRVPPSELAYYTDRGAYCELLNAADELATLRDENDDDELVSEVEGTITAVEDESLQKTTSTAVTGRRYVVESIKPAYAGRFAPATPQLVEKIKPVAPDVSTNVLENCLFTILAELERAAPIEWNKRESTIAEVSVLVDETFELTKVSLSREQRSQIVNLLADEIGNK